VHPALKRELATVFHSLGLGLSLYLALLKTFSLPCIGGGGCHGIIHSSYGSVLGMPVGYFGAVLWAGAALVTDRTKRAALLALLASGSLIFLCIQFFVLKGFCLYCTLHAAAAWLALAFNAQEPRRWAAVAGLGLALGGFGATRLHTASKAANSSPPATSATPIVSAAEGLAWLGDRTTQSPTLVISLDCPACLDLLEELTKQSYAGVTSGPAVFFKTTRQNETLTHVFVASVLASAAPKRESFLASTAILLSMKEQALSSPAAAAAQFSAFFPKAAVQLEEAKRVVAAQNTVLAGNKLGETTPLLIPVNGRARAFFRPEDLFVK
jgi:uncharacterized membrane protein